MKQSKILKITIILNSLLLSCSETRLITHKYNDYNGDVYQMVSLKNGAIVNACYICSNGDTIVLPLSYDQEAQLLLRDQMYITNVGCPQNICAEGDIYAILMVGANGSIIDRRIIKDVPGVAEYGRVALEALNQIKYVEPAQRDGVGVNSIKIIKIPFRLKHSQ